MVAQWCWVFFQLGSTRKERKIVSLTVKSSFQVQCKCPTLPANCPIPPTHHPQTSPFFSVNSALFCYICTVTRCVTCSLNLKNFSFLFFFSFFFFFFSFSVNVRNGFSFQVRFCDAIRHSAQLPSLIQLRLINWKKASIRWASNSKVGSDSIQL